MAGMHALVRVHVCVLACLRNVVRLRAQVRVFIPLPFPRPGLVNTPAWEQFLLRACSEKSSEDLRRSLFWRVARLDK